MLGHYRPPEEREKMARFELTPELKSKFVGNIFRIFTQATESEINDGIAWYSRARQDAERIAQRHEVAHNVAVAVVAALSPNNRWERNVRDADILITAYMDGESVESVSVCTYHKMRQKAWDILEFAHSSGSVNTDVDDGDLIRILKGQKIVCFFQNIMGHDACTIDGHARNICYNERLSLSGSKFTIGKIEYAALQECYRHAASVLTLSADSRIPNGIKAYELQAITWVAWRRIWGI